MFFELFNNLLEIKTAISVYKPNITAIANIYCVIHENILKIIFMNLLKKTPLFKNKHKIKTEIY